MTEEEWKPGRIPLKRRTKQPAEAMTYGINHRVKLEAMTILHEGEFSVGEIAKIMGEDVRYVNNHVRQLYEAGCIEYVGLRRIKGRARPVFRAVVVPVITDEDYDEMSRDDRYDVAGAMCQGFLAELSSSYRHRRMDGDEPPCVIWDAPPLDAEGREKLRKRLTEVWEEEVLAIHGESVNRAADSGEELIPTVAGLFSFERGRRGELERGAYRAEKN